MSLESVDLVITFRTDGRDHLHVTMDSRDGFCVFPSAQFFPKEFALTAEILAILKRKKDSYPSSRGQPCGDCRGTGKELDGERRHAFVPFRDCLSCSGRGLI